MQGLNMLLGALGIKVPPETVAQIEMMLPQVPGILMNSVKVVNETLANLNARQLAVEERLQQLTEAVERLIQENKNGRTNLITTGDRSNTGASTGNIATGTTAGAGRKRTN